MRMIREIVIFLLLCTSAVLALDSRWVLLWSDEFTESSLDTTKWTARDQPGYTSNGEQEYNHAANVYVSNGNLVIKSNPDTSVSGYTWASGFVDTSGKYSTTFGRYEINAKLPKGQGYWPAHWLLSDAGLCWPVGAEIDIMEDISKPINQIYGTYHFGAYCGNNLANGSMYDTGIDLSAGYHTYAVEWNSSAITWYFDTVAYKTVWASSLNNGHAWTMDTSPHYVILNTALGGPWAGNTDSTTTIQYHYIDYVRVYGWQPCVTGCGSHGCCDAVSHTCKCDSGYFGTFCEWTPGRSYSNSFVSAQGSDSLSGNAAISNGLTLQVKASGSTFSGGQWEYANSVSFGNFTFRVKSTGVSGSGLLLWGTSNSGSFTGFQVTLAGNSKTAVSLQTFGPSAGYQSYNLGFDSSAAYHDYMIVYSATTYVLYVDGKQALSAASGISYNLQPYIQLEWSTQYYGSWTATSASAYAASVNWIAAPSVKAVCTTPGPTIAPTSKPATTAPTKASTTAPTKAPTTAPTKAPTTAPTKAPTKPATPAPTTAPTTKPPGFSTNFNSLSANEQLTGNAVVGSGLLTLQITSSSGTYTGGKWQNNQAFAYGSFTFKVKATAVPGTALLLWGEAMDGSTFVGFQVGLNGNQPNQVSLQTFGTNPYGFTSFPLAFDPTAAFHTYTVQYGTVFKLYVDGTLVVTTGASGTSVPMVMSIDLEYGPQYWGTFTGTTPVTDYANYASWTSA